MKDERETFKSSDLAIVAFLYLSGHSLIEVEGARSGRSVFVFRDSPSLAGDLGDFWEKNARVEPQEYFDAIKKMKTRIYQDY